MKRTIPNRKQNPIPKALLLGGVIGYGWSILCTVVAAKLIEQDKLSFESIGYTAVMIHLTAGMVAAIPAWTTGKKRRMALALGAGGIYYLMLLATTALFFDGIYTGMGTAAVLIALGSQIPGLRGLIGRGNRIPAHYKIKPA